MSPNADAQLTDGLLRELEQELAAGDGATYGRRLSEGAIAIVPTRVLDKVEMVMAVDEAGGWDGFSLENEREERLGPDAALISDRFSGHRGAYEYTAQFSSVYVREDGDWLLLLHQQTPLE
jgi:hypothetical protein